MRALSKTKAGQADPITLANVIFMTDCQTGIETGNRELISNSIWKCCLIALEYVEGGSAKGEQQEEVLAKCKAMIMAWLNACFDCFLESKERREILDKCLGIDGAKLAEYKDTIT